MNDRPARVRPLYNSSDPLSRVLDLALARTKAEAEALSSQDLIERSAIESLRKKSEIAPLAIKPKRATLTRTPQDVVVRASGGASKGQPVIRPGLFVVVTVPYSGSITLLQHKASGHKDLDVRGRLLSGKIEFSETFLWPTSKEAITGWKERILSDLTANAEAANAEVRTHNEKVAAMLSGVLDERRAAIAALRRIAEELD